MPVKHPMLGSFEGLLKTMGHAFGQQPSQERTLVEEGSFLGRKWQLYSDGTIEGETVAGMQRMAAPDAIWFPVCVARMHRRRRL